MLQHIIHLLLIGMAFLLKLSLMKVITTISKLHLKAQELLLDVQQKKIMHL